MAKLLVRAVGFVLRRSRAGRQQEQSSPASRLPAGDAQGGASDEALVEALRPIAGFYF